MILSIDHIVLTINDMDKTISFYCDVLGMTVKEFQSVNGGAAAPTVTGSSLADTIQLQTFSPSDGKGFIINAGGGNDTITGSNANGSDTYVLGATAVANGSDTITRIAKLWCLE